jgi:hypothetical protein
VRPRALALVALTATGVLFAPTAISARPQTPEPARAAATQHGWILSTVYKDNFSGTELNSAWSRYDAPYGSGVENYARPEHFDVNGRGQLVLTMKYRTSGRDGAAWYTGGAMLHEQYGGQYQSIDIRYKVVSRGVVSKRNIPIRWVDDPAYEWYQGETNFNEGSSLKNTTTFLHYGPDDQVVKNYRVDLTKWHRWRFVHRPDRRIQVFLDGKLVWDYQGTAKTVPDAFRRVVLQQEVSASNMPRSTSGSERILVDSIRVRTYLPR